jgi:hypothetical protein
VKKKDHFIFEKGGFEKIQRKGKPRLGKFNK